MKQWEATNTDKAEYVGIIEFQDNEGEYHNFEILKTDSRIVFGGNCNVGLLESGYMEIDNCFSFDENLQELISDLETFYNDGKEYVSRIVCNERM
ncbi:MAG: hypothetical protein WC055_00155 [Melioribacteraceae bacterium]